MKEVDALRDIVQGGAKMERRTEEYERRRSQDGEGGMKGLREEELVYSRGIVPKG